MNGFLPAEESWTILKEDGSLALDFDVFLNFDAKTENPTVQAPVEEGGFTMYNKIQTPLEIAVGLGFKSKNLGDLDNVVQSLLDLSSSTDLVNIITPEYEFKNFNLEKLAWSRQRDQGAYVLYVDLGFIEVKQVKTEYGNAKIAKRQNRGQQQQAKEESFLSMGTSWFTG